jgi:hypothetical protein
MNVTIAVSDGLRYRKLYGYSQVEHRDELYACIFFLEIILARLSDTAAIVMGSPPQTAYQRGS